MSILTHVKLDGYTFQHDLIEKLPYSNKSIITYLKKMVSAGILEQGMKQIIEKERKIWMKWYVPTQLGKWFILFLKQPTEISAELTKEAVAELFQLYSKSIVEACKKYKISIDSFHDALDKHYLETIKKTPKTMADVVVFGSAALDIYGRIEKLPEPEETIYIEETGSYLGGMGSNVAVALARLEVPTAFMGKIGTDHAARLLLENLKENHVDISSLSLEKLNSLQTLVLSDQEGKRYLFVIGSKNAALSITSPKEIDWDMVKNCKIVYIGEVFVEMASTIANFAKTQGKTVIYRPGAPYLKFGVEKLDDILEHADIFILNNIGWKILRESSKRRLETPTNLLKENLNTVIITKGAEGCETYTSKERFISPIPETLLKRFKVVDPTGAGDAFSAGVIKGLLEGWSLKKAISYGQVVSAIKCSRIGTGPAFPTLNEVENAFQTLHSTM
jgi:ribokinase